LPDFRVRAIRRTDREQWTPLWRAYLDFYRAPWSDEVADATFARIFDPLEPVHALVAERGDELIGLAHYLFQRSTWLLNSQCYLQDLYVGEAVRGLGVGRALIAAVVGAAREAGAARVFWNTHETNTVARGLYDAVGQRTGLIQYRIEPLG
jgi:GNAT superfamily N-acetyltransferase